MPKSVSAHTVEEKKELMDKIKAIYEEHGSPKWLKAKFYTECVNILNAGQQQVQEVLQIEGKAPLDEKEKADKMKAAITEVCKDVIEKEVEIGCSYGVGGKMGVIEGAGKICVNEQMGDGAKVQVKHEAGQVLLLDFWATWCPPCQKPMAHNQEMLEKRGAEWGDKVRLIGLSIDQDEAKLKAHVQEKKWTKVEHYWVRNGACTASDEYGVQGVPHVLLVDTKGEIVFMGHPASRNIEQDIDNLLKGEKLSGEGTAPAGGAADSGAADEGKATADDVAKFKADTKDWVVGMKEKAGKLQRAFLVMTCDQVHNFSTGASSCDVTVHTVIMGGDEADRSAVHEECKKHNQGPWKNRDQV